MRTVITSERRTRIVLKNVAVIPKALWLANIVRRHRVEHIHAHWAGTSATMAWLAAKLANLPWSFTAHRWDIDEANALAAKLREASFGRAISKRGFGQMRKFASRDNLRVIPMGVAVPASVPKAADSRRLRILVPANLFVVKGHRYLLQALATLLPNDIVIRCEFAGSGPELDRLMALSQELGLENTVSFLGAITQSEVIDRYSRGGVDLVVLPSIVTEEGEQEGIPVALMEAMSFAIPVISTRTGAIPELVEGVGLLVPPKDAKALGDAILSLVDPTARRELGNLGRNRVSERFDVAVSVRLLLDAIERC